MVSVAVSSLAPLAQSALSAARTGSSGRGATTQAPGVSGAVTVTGSEGSPVGATAGTEVAVAGGSVAVGLAVGVASGWQAVTSITARTAIDTNFVVIFMTILLTKN